MLSGFRVTRSLVLCVCFADRCMSFCTFFFWPLCCLFFFDMQILVASLWYLQTLLIEYIKKSLLNCQHLPRGLFAHFHNTIGELYTIFFFFPIKTDDETTILVVYDIYFINQWLKMTKIKTNKQKTKRQKQTNK